LEILVSKFEMARPLGSMLLLTAALLAACGGGGGSGEAVALANPNATQTVTYAPAVLSATDADVYLINPAASWKKLQSAMDGFVGALAYIDLSRLLPAGTAAAGQTLEIQALGLYYYNAAQGGTPAQSNNNVSIVFVDGNGALLRLPAGSALVPAHNTNCATSPPSTDPNAPDVMVPLVAGGRVTVPAGAVRLLVSVDDCFFSDNVSEATDPVRIRVKLAAAGG
jgi:hypothetical protein